MNSRNPFHELTAPIRKTGAAAKSLPQVKQYFRKRIAKCLNECKLQTLNMKKSITFTGNHHSSVPHPAGDQPEFNEYEYGWGSDFDDLDDDDDDDLDPTTTDQSGNNSIDQLTCAMNMVDLVEEKPTNIRRHNQSSPRRPLSEPPPPPPPLPKCPPPSDLDCLPSMISVGRESDNLYEVMSVANTATGDSDYLMPNITKYNADPIERPLPPIPINNESLSHYPWFYDIERDEAETVVRRQGVNGCFVVRHSRRAGINNPYSLTLFYNHRIFHLNIRKRPDQLYALGTAKPKEKTFHFISDMIDYHHDEPIYLTTKGTIAGKTTLISLIRKK